MDKNPLMDAFRKEFLRQAERAGFHHSAGEDGGEEICYKMNTVATLTAGYGLDATGDMGTNRLFDQLQRLRDVVLEPYYLFRSAPPLSVCDDPDTRVLCEFGGVALTARVRPDGAMEYATCQYRFDRTGVRDFSTPVTDFSAAKEQFAIRAGLIPENRLVKQAVREPTALEVAQADSPEIAIRQVGVPVGLFEERVEPGYLLEDGAVLLDSERTADGNYLGGAGMNGMHLKTEAVYAPVRDEAGAIRSFQKLDAWREKVREPLAAKPAMHKRGQDAPER